MLHHPRATPLRSRTIAIALLLGLSVAASAKPAAPPAPAPAKSWTREDRPLKARSLGRLHVGARVRLNQRDRELEQAETGHPRTLAYGPGQIGTVKRFIHRVIHDQKLGDTGFDMAVVRWDAQTWYEWETPLHRMQDGKVSQGTAADLDRMNGENGAAVKLRAFELPAHLEELDLVE